MIKYYKQSKLTTRIISTLLFVALIAVIAWKYNYNPLTPSIIVVSLAAVGELFFFHRRMFITGLFTLIHLFITSSISLLIFTVLNVSLKTPLVAYFESTGYMLSAVTATLVTLIGGYFLAKGRLWLNSLIAYILYDGVTGFLIPFGFNISYIVQGFIGLGVVIAWIIFRMFIPRKKSPPFDEKLLKSGKAAKETAEMLKGKFSETQITMISKHFILQQTEQAIIVLLPIAPKKYFTLIKNDVWLDSNAVTGIFEYLLKESKNCSNGLKLSRKHIIPVLYVTEKNTFPQPLTFLRIRSKVSPDKTLGSVYVASPKGYRQLLTGLKKRKNLPATVVKKVEKFHNSVTLKN